MQNLCRHHGLFKHFRHSDREAGVSGVLLKRSSWSHLRYRPKFPLQHREFYRRVLQFGDFTLMGEKKTDDCYVTRRAKLQKCLTARGIYCPCLTQQHYVKSERVLSGTYVLLLEIIPLLFSFFLSCTQNMSRSVVGSVPYAPQQLVSCFRHHSCLSAVLLRFFFFFFFRHLCMLSCKSYRRHHILKTSRCIR